MDPLRFAVAVVPIAAYLILIGLINSRRRPVVVTGGGDLATLGLALTGLALVGPISLFRPEAATAEMGNYVWLLMLSCYVLGVVLVVMLCRPRLVIYNLPAEELRPILSEAIRHLDGSGRWAGESLSLPTLGVQAHIDSLAWMRNTSLIASGGRQDLAGWRRLGRSVERSLRGSEQKAVGTQETSAVGRGAALIGIGTGLLLVAIIRLSADPDGVAIAWRQIF